MTVDQLIDKLRVEPLTETESETLFKEIVGSLGEMIEMNLGFDVQDNVTVGFARCIAYEVEPAMGHAAIQVMSFIGIQTDENRPVLADVLLFSQGNRLCRTGARSGEFVRFTASQSAPTSWKLEGWIDDEYGEYEQYLQPLQ